MTFLLLVIVVLLMLIFSMLRAVKDGLARSDNSSAIRALGKGVQRISKDVSAIADRLPDRRPKAPSEPVEEQLDPSVSPDIAIYRRWMKENEPAREEETAQEDSFTFASSNSRDIEILREWRKKHDQ